MFWISAAVLVAGGLLCFLAGGVHLAGLLAATLLAVAVLLGRQAFAGRAAGITAPRPRRPVVIWNPRSGGGKALSAHLADEARARGIEPIELHPGEDLVQLVEAAVARGADALAAAGGDGTQALVATIAARHDLPFACIPAGTRNHFALDLGVDRNDVVGSLDAFIDGWEKRVDLGAVGDRTFVNNVSLGLYAQAVQSEGYREAKIRTLLSTAATERGDQHRSDAELSWTGPDGEPECQAAVILVSNNVYRLGRVVGSGTRPRMDGGVLGIAVVSGQRGGARGPGAHAADAHDADRRRAGRRAPWQEWKAPEFRVESSGDISLGLDGEALVMASPLVFRSRAGVLRVRIAGQHPGLSPSARLPADFPSAIRALFRLVATGRVTSHARPRRRAGEAGSNGAPSP